MKNLCFILITSISLSLIIVSSALGQRSVPGELKTVEQVDLERYAGKWYEIAKYFNKFQKKCTGNVTADYTLKKNGRIEVRNECLKKNGELKVAVGEAKIKDDTSNAKLKVRFAPSFLSFLPFVWGDYWIIDLDEDYEWVAIGEPSRTYFWILSRKPTLDEPVYQAILDRAGSAGFDPAKVVKTPQEVVSQSTVPRQNNTEPRSQKN